MRDFQAELKRVIDKVAGSEPSINPTMRPRPIEKLYNVHKRSLPVGIDKVIVFNVSKSEAVSLIEHKLKTKFYNNGDKDSKTLIYFDIIPVNATPKERSIYFNEKPVTVD